MCEVEFWEVFFERCKALFLSGLLSIPLVDYQIVDLEFFGNELNGPNC